MAAPRPATNKIIQFKLVLLGEAAVGKSSLVLRFVKGEFKVYILPQELTICGSNGATRFLKDNLLNEVIFLCCKSSFQA